ncbi:MAG TPA: nuclear transport factor 2 family protein [Thermoanaerobaculia bacterium]
MIRKRIVLILVVLLLPVVVAAADGPPGTREEQEKALVDLETRRSQAIWNTDLETLDRIYAEDFRGLLGNGQFTDKAGLFEVFKNQDSGLRFTIEDLDARILGTAAVTHGRFTGRNAKGDLVMHSRFTHVWAWRDGRWQVVEGVNTPMPRE